LEKNPPLVKYLAETSHEIAGHGYRWMNYANCDEDLEKEHIGKAIKGIEQMTGKKMAGWYTGRRSPYTRKLIAASGRFGFVRGKK
jgi:peptidoglycan/xylan/chitin deacetylase (PgdA/CDA1 family)